MKIKQTLLAAALTGVAVLALSPVGSVSAAGSASFSLTPASGSYSQNATISVTVKETSTDPVAGVEANLTYDANKLQCLAVDGSTSAFVREYQATCSGGNVTIARTTQGTTLTGSQTVAVVRFKALASSGSAQVTLTSSSDVYRSPDAAPVGNGVAVVASFGLVPPASTPAPVTTTSTPAPAATGSSTKKATSTQSKSAVLSDEAQKAADAEKAAKAEADKKAAEEAAKKKQAENSKKTDDKKSSSTTQKILLGLGIFALAAAAAQALQRRKLANEEQSAKKAAAPVVPPATERKKPGANAQKKNSKKSNRKR